MCERFLDGFKTFHFSLEGLLWSTAREIVLKRAALKNKGLKSEMKGFECLKNPVTRSRPFDSYSYKRQKSFFQHYQNIKPYQ